MKPTKTKIVKPEPYFEIGFGCTNRQFYTVKSELYEIGAKIGIKPQDGYMEESCDYEGDLEEIRIYRGNDDCEKFVKAVLEYYEITDEVPENMDLVLSVY